MSYTVAFVSKIAQPYGACNGSTLRGANREAECATQVRSAEAVGAHELPLPLNIAQPDVLAVPAHALKKHTIMNTLLALGHTCNVPSAGPVQSPLSQRGLAVQREIVLRPLAAQQLLLCPRNDSFAREVAKA